MTAVAASALLAVGCAVGPRSGSAGSSGLSGLAGRSLRPVAVASSTAPAPSSRALSEALSPDGVPTLLTIPSLGIKAPVVVTGTDPDGVPETPPFDRPDEVGWYGRTASPGSEGASVIWGHLDTPKQTAVFLHLRDLRPGAQIQVARDDDTSATFTVERVTGYPDDDFPSDLVYDDPSYPALRLITCGGAFDRKTRAYLGTVVVFARLTASGPSAR
jgi:sortase (surface protein transpeptidase)